MQNPLEKSAIVAAALLLSCVSSTAAATPLEAQQVDELQRRVAELEGIIAMMRADYDARFVDIEQQLARLGDTPPPAPPAETDELAAEARGGEAGDPEERAGEAVDAEERAEMEREIAALLGESDAVPAAGATPPQQGAGQRFSNQARNLNELNPEISATGDVFATFSDHTGDPEANQFRLGEFEIALQATLDPYSSAKFALVQEDGEVSLEEGFLEFNSLPGALGLKVGQMRLDWGKLNRWHQHALPQVDRPLVHQAMLGEEGLTGLGTSLSWLPPPFLGDYNEVIVQVANDNNDVLFSGRGFDQPVYLVHETNYFDISPATYFELGVSATTGTAGLDGQFRNQLYGTDWNFNWAPPATALYRGFELRGELMWQRRDGPGGVTSSLGAYTYGVYKLNRRSFVGLRGDWTELPLEPGARLWGTSPYYEWWQSEWVRFRLQYSYLSRQIEAIEPEHKFFIQLTWSMGPHKHEKY